MIVISFTAAGAITVATAVAALGGVGVANSDSAKRGEIAQVRYEVDGNKRCGAD